MTFVNGSTLAPNQNNGPSPAVPYPSGIAAGDILIGVFVMQHAFGAGTDPVQPTGWTKMGASITMTANRRVTFAWKVADGTESGSVTFTVSNGDFSNGAIAAYRNVGTPYPYTGLPLLAAAGTSATTQSMLADHASDFVVLIQSNPESRTLSSPPAGFTTDYDSTLSGGTDVISFASGPSSATPSSQSFTLGISGTTTGQWATCALYFNQNPSAYWINGSYLLINNQGTSPLIPVPLGVLAGDLFVGVFEASTVPVVAVPTGWTTISPGVISGAATRSWLFGYKVADGTESGNFTFTVTGGAQSAGIIGLYRNIGTPYTSLARQAAAASSGASPSLTVVSAADRILLMQGNADGPFVNSPPAGFTVDFDAQNTGGSDMAGTVTGLAAAPGSQNWTLGMSGAISGNWGIAAIALSPPPPPPPIDPTLGMIHQIVKGRFPR